MTCRTHTGDRRAAGNISGTPYGFDATGHLAYENAMSRFVATGTTGLCQAFPAVAYATRSAPPLDLRLEMGVERATCDPTHPAN
jgi:hypothetical protein